MKILLIAGHGGTPYDSGALGCGYTEAVETRRIVNALAPKLQAYGFEVAIYDQRKDAYKTVCQGGNLPLSGVSYVLEVHLNSAAKDPSGNGVTTGTEIFVHIDEKGTTVEQAILRHMCVLGFKNRGVKPTSEFAVLRHVFNRGISHALLETCFIDDRDDMTLYGAKFDAIVQAVADGVVEGFGKTVQKEDDEVIETKTVLVDGKEYACECIEKGGNNFVKLRSLSQAGYSVVFDAARQLPAITAPQCRTFVPDGDEAVQDAVDTPQEKCDLEAKTINYLRRYEYGDELVIKLAQAME